MVPGTAEGREETPMVVENLVSSGRLPWGPRVRAGGGLIKWTARFGVADLPSETAFIISGVNQDESVRQRRRDIDRASRGVG